jgi:hypothetical protein
VSSGEPSLAQRARNSQVLSGDFSEAATAARAIITLGMKIPRDTLVKRKRMIHFSFPPKGSGLLRLSIAFSVTLTGRFGIGMVRMGAEEWW